MGISAEFLKKIITTNSESKAEEYFNSILSEFTNDRDKYLENHNFEDLGTLYLKLLES